MEAQDLKNIIDEAIKDQKKYKTLKFVLITLLFLISLITVGFVFERKKNLEADIIKQKELIQQSTLLMKQLSYRWDTLPTYDTVRKLLLADIILSIPDYGDTSLMYQKSKVKKSNRKDSISNNLSTIISNVDKNSSKTKTIEAQLDSYDREISSLQHQLNVLPDKNKIQIQNEISQINKEVQNFLDTSKASKIDSAVKMAPKVDNLIQQLNSSNTNSNVSGTNFSKDYGISWFKVGYYLQYDNVRILLQDLDKKKGIEIRMCKTIGNEICTDDNALVNYKWIPFNAPFSINIDGSRYQVSLQTIDHAGNNPFKLAAYINVLKLGSDSSDFFLLNSTVKIYSINSVSDKAKQVDNVLKSKGVDSQNSGSPDGYTLNNVKQNQIVYYNNDQYQKCQAVQSLLKDKGLGTFIIRPSSGFGYKTEHFKIYLIN